MTSTKTWETDRITTFGFTVDIKIFEVFNKITNVSQLSVLPTSVPNSPFSLSKFSTKTGSCFRWKHVLLLSKLVISRGLSSLLLISSDSSLTHHPNRRPLKQKDLRFFGLLKCFTPGRLSQFDICTVFPTFKFYLFPRYPLVHLEDQRSDITWLLTYHQ